MSLFGRGKGKRKAPSVTPKEFRAAVWWALELVSDYGGLLEKIPSGIRDTSELPYPKDEIKTAIEMLLNVTAPSEWRSFRAPQMLADDIELYEWIQNYSKPEFRAAMKSSYVSLARWQDGAGNTDEKMIDLISQSQSQSALRNGDEAALRAHAKAVAKAAAEGQVSELHRRSCDEAVTLLKKLEDFE